MKNSKKLLVISGLLFQLTSMRASSNDQNNLAAWQDAANAFSSQGTPAQLLSLRGSVNAGQSNSLAKAGGDSPQEQALGLYLANGNSARNANSFPGNEGLDAAAGLNMVINAAANGSSSTPTTPVAPSAPATTPVAPPAPATTPVTPPAPATTPVQTYQPIVVPTADSTTTGMQVQILTNNAAIGTINTQINTYNAQITSINKQIKVANNEIKKLESANKELDKTRQATSQLDGKKRNQIQGKKRNNTNRINALNNKITTLKGQITSIQANIDAAQQQITTLNAQTASLQAQLAA